MVTLKTKKQAGYTQEKQCQSSITFLMKNKFKFDQVFVVASEYCYRAIPITSMIYIGASVVN